MNPITAKVLQFLRERKWDKPRPGDLAKSISIEAAELLELFQWDNRTLIEVRRDKVLLEKVQKELADVMIYAHQMAGFLNLDVKEIIEKKLKHAAEKYPAALMRKNDAGYYQRKEEYRRKGIN